LLRTLRAVKQNKMKNITFIVGILIANSFFSQNNVQHFETNQDLPEVLRYDRIYSNHNKIQSCSIDTIYYTDAKASSQAIKVAFTTGSTSTGFAIGYSQLFEGSTNVTVRGFKWYGKSYDPTQTSNPTINVVCEMYDAGTDGLPTGAPLASETVIVDTNSNNLEHDVIFTTPIVTSNNYVIVVKNNQADQLFVMSNDEMANDGAGESLSGVFYEPLGTWRKSDQIFGFGDFDILVLPFVEYSITAGFTTPATGCQNVASSFTNTSSNHFTNTTLNVDAFNSSSLQHDWTYGDGNTDDDLTTGSNSYATAGTYNIALVSTLNGWTMTCTDATANSFLVNPTPATPTAVAPTQVCEYTAIGDLTASGGVVGSVYTWYDNSGTTDLLGTGSPFTSGITLTDTVYVTITENGCEGAEFELPIPFDTNAIPVFTLVNQGSGTFDFTGAPTAATYAWDFDDGNTSTFQTPTNVFATSGPFSVCLDVIYANSCTNQYCESVSLVGVEESLFETMISAFPNPTDGVLNINFEYFPNSTQIVLFDSYGKFVSRIQAFENNTISLDNLASGIYFLSIEEEGKIISRKKVVKK